MITYSEPLSFYLNDEDSPLLFHLLNVGQGLMSLIIFPDETTMMYDCNVTDENEEDILNYLSENIPQRYNSITGKYEQWIDIFVCSHRDSDHLRGLDKVNQNFTIRSIWDSEQSGNATDSSDYNYFMSLRRTLKEEYGEDSLFLPEASLKPVMTISDAEVYCLSPHKESEIEDETKKQHTNCIVLSIKYANKSILLTGDSDWYAWKNDIVPLFQNTNILESQLLVASHHGSRSFFTETSGDNEGIDIEKYPETTYLDALDYIKPIVTLVPCGLCQEPHNLPNTEAMSIYRQKTAQGNVKQVYTTYDKGHMVGFINNIGNWTIVPTRFKNINNSTFNFMINCIADKYLDVPHKSTLSKGRNLVYQIQSDGGGLLDPIDKVSVSWEVSNFSLYEDEMHQEIYYKNEDELKEKLKFSRNLEFQGTHLLRCRVKNPNKNADITKVFIINCS